MVSDFAPSNLLMTKSLQKNQQYGTLNSKSIQKLISLFLRKGVFNEIITTTINYSP